MISYAIYALVSKVASRIDKETIHPQYQSFCAQLKNLEEKLSNESLPAHLRLKARSNMEYRHAKINALLSLLEVHRAPNTSMATLQREVRMSINNKVMDASILNGFLLYPISKTSASKSLWDLPNFWKRDTWMREYVLAEIFKAESAIEQISLNIRSFVFNHNELSTHK